MKVVAIADRQEPNGHTFKTVHVIQHTPLAFKPGTAGWTGEGAGLSYDDFQNIIADLGAANVVGLCIDLVD